MGAVLNKKGQAQPEQVGQPLLGFRTLGQGIFSVTETETLNFVLVAEQVHQMVEFLWLLYCSICKKCKRLSVTTIWLQPCSFFYEFIG